MSEITPQELKARLDSNDAPLLLDVRQEWETQLCRLPNAVHIPIEEFELRTDELNPEDEIVVYCHQGVRSAAVAEFLRAARLQEREEPRGRAGSLGPHRRPLDASLLMATPRSGRAGGRVVRCTLDRPPLNLFEPGPHRRAARHLHELARRSHRASRGDHGQRARLHGRHGRERAARSRRRRRRGPHHHAARRDRRGPPCAVPGHRRDQRRGARRRLRAGTGV